MLGMSLNGLGKKVGTIAQLGAEVSEQIRKHHEQLWENAEVVELAPDDNTPSSAAEV